MVPKLRLRTSQQPEACGDGDRILRSSPPTSPPRQPLAVASGSAVATDVKQSRKRRVKLTSTKTILAAMLSLSTLVLLSSGRIHSRLSRGLKRPSYSGWGWEPTLRQQDGRGNGGGRFHPRVATADMPISIQPKKLSILSSIQKMFTSQRIAVDEMLHHDGWVESDDSEEENASIWSRWSDFSFWKHEDTQHAEEEKQCVPMAEWQTTSYPNCNVGKSS